MIKKISILLIGVLVIGTISSCSDYLNSEKYFKDRLTIEKTFENKTHVEEWLAYAFSFVNGENREVTTKNPGNNSFCFADDMYYGDRDKAIDDTKNELSYNMFKLGEYDENSYNVGAWEACYKGIFQASVFIHNIYRCKEMADWEIEDYKGQARFIRAYYYWLLLRRYGPVPIMPDEGVDYTESYEQLATPRSSYEEVAQYISDEMIQAAKELKYDRRTDNFAVTRPTRGAALAARAYALIFAASPFANGNNDEYAQALVDDKGRRLLSPEYTEEKWAKAAAACRDVIELGVYDLVHVNNSTSDNGPSERSTVTPPADGEFSTKSWPDGWTNIDPLKSYRYLFDGTLLPANNQELIFTRGSTEIDMMVLHQMPKDDGGWNCHGMTQKMLDAYYMNDGNNAPGMNSMYQGVAGYEGRVDANARKAGFTNLKDLKDGKYPELGWKYDSSKADDQQASTGMNVSLQYVKREPRFYASVAYNGSTWYYLSQTENRPNDINQQVWYYFGSSDGYRNDGFYLRTGIGIKKFVHPNDYPGNYVAKAETAIRYADILLLYAEALNELTQTYNIASWNNATTYSVSREKSEMERGIHPVRIRAGLPDYPDAYYESDMVGMRKALKRERMIELMGEGKRYFDLRRWKDAPLEEAVQIYGCNVFVNVDKREDFHSVIPIYNLPSTFSEKLWLWPIRHSELKRNSRLTQNPGWTMYD